MFRTAGVREQARPAARRAVRANENLRDRSGRAAEKQRAIGDPDQARSPRSVKDLNVSPFLYLKPAVSLT
jgi:hypothetical protein